MSTLYVDTINEKTSGNGVQIDGHVMFIKTAELAGDTSAVSTSTSYTNTGLTITIPQADVDKCSKLLIVATGAIRINKNTHAFADFRLQRTAPTTTNYKVSEVGVVSGGTEVYDQVAIHEVDDDLTSADHTYVVQFRKAFGNSTYAGNIFYKNMGWNITVMGIA